MIHAVLWQRIEGLLVLAAGLALFFHFNDTMPWWVALLIFFAPDLSFIAYAFGPRVGAFCYNLVHIYGFGAALLAVGVLAAIPLLTVLGACGWPIAASTACSAMGSNPPKAFPSPIWAVSANSNSGLFVVPARPHSREVGSTTSTKPLAAIVLHISCHSHPAQAPRIERSANAARIRFKRPLSSDNETPASMGVPSNVERSRAAARSRSMTLSRQQWGSASPRSGAQISSGPPTITMSSPSAMRCTTKS